MLFMYEDACSDARVVICSPSLSTYINMSVNIYARVPVHMCTSMFVRVCMFPTATVAYVVCWPLFPRASHGLPYEKMLEQFSVGCSWAVPPLLLAILAYTWPIPSIPVGSFPYSYAVAYPYCRSPLRWSAKQLRLFGIGRHNGQEQIAGHRPSPRSNVDPRQSQSPKVFI